MARSQYSEILVTGGFGYLGGRIADYYRGRGQAVAIVGLQSRGNCLPWAEQYDCRIADVTAPATLKSIMRPGAAVIHCASANQPICEKDPGQAVQVNGLGTFHMLEQAAAAGVKRFIYLSTFHVYGRVEAPEINEDSQPKPELHYGISHLLGEMFVGQARAHGFDAVSIRPTNGYGAPAHIGANCWMLALNDFCRNAVNEGRIVLATAGTQQRDFVSIGDIIQAINILLEMDSRPAPAYNVAGDNLLSIRDLAERVAKVANRDFGRKIELNVPASTGLAASRWIPYSCERIKRLGYRPSDRIDESARELFQMLGWK